MNATLTKVQSLFEKRYTLSIYNAIEGSQGRSSIQINIILFLMTVFSTLWMGWLSPEYNPEGLSFPNNPLDLFKAWPFALSVLSIVLCHEFGHYIPSQLHKVKATLPFIIPMPIFSPFGTLGAVIRIKSPIPNHRALMRIGALGPISGFIVAVVVIIIGISISDVVPEAEITESSVYFADPLLIKLIMWIMNISVPAGHTIMASDVYFAGWFGLLITALNLMPVGQLDGGHVAYAMFGKKRAKVIAYITILSMFIMGLFFFYAWWFWIIMIALVIKANHPPLLDESKPLAFIDKVLGGLCIAIIVLCFMSLPIQIGYGPQSIIGIAHGTIDLLRYYLL